MRGFRMCELCRREYADRLDRRFHAQPIACPICGPRLLEGTIEEAAAAIQCGHIVALKGVGGFQLLTDARNVEAVARLRARKHREEKPLAMMMPSLDLIRRYCHVSSEEVRVLTSAAAPIVLLSPRCGSEIASNVAANSAYWGVMLPYSPLHHELMRHCPIPVVATSGNRSDEPIAIDNGEAHERLGGIADVFLTHDRPIERPCDDSVVRVTNGQPCVIRRARGYAPLPVAVHRDTGRVLAVGGHTKNTVAIGMGNQVIVSQHIGDLDTVEARGAFERAIQDLLRLYRFEPSAVVCDLHPDYASARWALASGLPAIRVQHHQAHVAACAAENALDEPYLGIAWDGTGLGLDGTIWGGEFFAVTGDGMERIASLRPFRLQGGEAGARDCWRSAASLVAATFGNVDLPQLQVPAQVCRSLLEGVLHRGVNAPVTTSVGRLFDAVASLTGVSQYNHFEGQAAMALEAEIGSGFTRAVYPLPDGDWEPLLLALVEDLRKGVPRPLIAAKFHNALVEWIGEVASRAGIGQVVLSGGVFQNGYLVERACELLESRGFHVYTHHQVPANDGGLALGQAVLGGCH